MSSVEDKLGITSLYLQWPHYQLFVLVFFFLYMYNSNIYSNACYPQFDHLFICFGYEFESYEIKQDKQPSWHWGSLSACQGSGFHIGVWCFTS